MKVGFSVFLLLLLLVELAPVLGRGHRRTCDGRKCKVHEESSRPIDFRLCGDHIMKAYIDICKLWVRRKRKRDISADLFVQTKNEAQDFLSFKRTRRRRSTTDVIEECCDEGCRTEELREYCP